MSRIHFDDTVFDFYSRFISWITDALEQTDIIGVEGNQGLSQHSIPQRHP